MVHFLEEGDVSVDGAFGISCSDVTAIDDSNDVWLSVEQQRCLVLFLLSA